MAATNSKPKSSTINDWAESHTPTQSQIKRKQLASSPDQDVAVETEEPAITNFDLMKQMQSMMSTMNENMDKQFQSLKNDMANLQATVTALSAKQQELTAENRDLKDEINSLNAKVKTLTEDRNVAIEMEIHARDDLEAQQRRYNLNISGITQVGDPKKENCKEIVNAFLKQLVPSYDCSTLDVCHRTAAGALICRFTSRTARDLIYSNRKKLMHMTTNDFVLPGNNKKNKMYINDNLTFLRAKIFKVARNLCYTYNDSNNTSYRVFVYRGFITAATPTVGDVKGVMTTLKTEKSAIEYFNKL